MNANSTDGPVVRIVNAQKSFGANPVLRGINLEVAAGEVVCILGPSGSGKSTLLRCVNALETLDDGYVEAAGHLVGYVPVTKGVRRASSSELAQQRANVGMVFQQFNLFPHLSVIDNVLLAPRTLGLGNDDDLKRLGEQLLTRVGLAEKIDVWPTQLSGGQQQRVAIARALAMKPEVMLFDEPTSALDPELVGEVLGVMRDLADAGTTMIVVTHEIGFARDVADRIVIIDGGKIIESGSPREVISNPATGRGRDFLARVASDAQIDMGA